MSSRKILSVLKKKGINVVYVKYDRGTYIGEPSYLIQLAEGEGAYIKKNDADYFTIQDEWEDDQYIVSPYDLDEVLECISPKGEI